MFFPSMKGMAAGLGEAAKYGARRYGGSMAVGAAAGYMASDDGFMSTTAGMAGGAALGFAATRGAFGKGMTRMANRMNYSAANPMKAAKNTKMMANNAYNSIKSTLGKK